MTELSALGRTRRQSLSAPRAGAYGRKAKPKRGAAEDAAAERARVMALNQAWAITW